MGAVSGPHTQEAHGSQGCGTFQVPLSYPQLPAHVYTPRPTHNDSKALDSESGPLGPQHHSVLSEEDSELRAGWQAPGTSSLCVQEKWLHPSPQHELFSGPSQAHMLPQSHRTNQGPALNPPGRTF